MTNCRSVRRLKAQKEFYSTSICTAKMFTQEQGLMKTKTAEDMPGREGKVGSKDSDKHVLNFTCGKEKKNHGM